MDVIFLGVNDVGMRVYEWLGEREEVTIQCLVTESDQLRLIRTLEPDIVVSVGFGHLVPEEVLVVPPAGCINLHPSYLPYNRGASPNVWSIVEDTPAGVTLHYMSAEIDRGDIIARREVDSRFDDSGKSLYRRLEQAQFELFTDEWPAIERGEVSAEPQASDTGSYFSTNDFRDLCRLDPKATVEVKELLDRLRALTFPPFANAHLEVDGERYYVNVDITHEDDIEPDPQSGLLESY